MKDSKGNSAVGSVATNVIGSFALPDKFDLSQHATLIRAKIGSWSGKEKNEDAGNEAADARGAKRDRVDGYIKLVVKDHPLKKAVDQKTSEARNWIKENLSYWDGVYRLATNLQYDKVMTQLRAFRAEYYQVVEKFLDGLPEMEASAAADLSGYSGTFPARSELERRLTFDIITSAIADVNDIRLKHVSAETAREIEESTRRIQAEKVTEVMTRLVERIAKAMEHFTAQMESEGQGYHKTAVTNIQELAAIIPELNLTGDPGIAAVARQIAETFSTVTVDELKKDPTKREDAKGKAISILDKVRAMKVTKKI